MSFESVKLPVWQSHKIVKAAPIAGVATDEDGNIVSVVPAVGEPLKVSGRPWAKGDKMPGVGDYVVVYENQDGGIYSSWSPKAEFEAGYTKLEPYQKPRG